MQNESASAAHVDIARAGALREALDTSTGESLRPGAAASGAVPSRAGACSCAIERDGGTLSVTTRETVCSAARGR